MSINPIYYSEDVKTIDKIEFTVFRNKDVKQYSAVSGDPFGIDLAESYENFEPKKGGLVDLRLGTCDIYLPCTTCGENSFECPGHFGHTELAEPVFHFGFLNHLKNILQCICLKCSNLLVEKSDTLFKKTLTKKAEARFKEIKLITKNVNYCYHCGVPVPKIKREVKDNGSIKIMIERDINTGTNNEKEDIANLKKIKESLSPRDCYNILRNVADNDCYLMGFNPKMQRPEDLIIEKFPIPPVIIRPTAKVDFMSASTMEDALTLKISDIITANKRVRQQMEKETVSNELSTYNQDIFNLLQYHVATYFDNDSVSLPRTEFKTGGRPTKSINDRIKGKPGRVRGNLMGKRVDFSARSVITSDPYIDIDQVGVPKKIAMELTIPEEVTPYNIKYLTGLVKNGSDVYPGANFVVRSNYRDGKLETQKIDLKYRKKAIRLNLGDVVERHSVDDDYVLFNRQPTLHKPSMMGHKMQIIDNDDLNTLRMNVSACKPYNADFDGDEMNIHLAQSIQARNELKRIANVQYQIVGAKDSSPIIGCQQDTLSGAYMLTEPNVRVKGWEVATILCNTTSDTKMNIEMNKVYTGHEIFSHIIPVGINNTKKSGDKITFQIVNGKLTIGYLDKSSLSFAKNSIIHFIWDKFGPNKTRRFIDDSQRLVLNYLLTRGQTVGFKDTVIDDKMNNQIQQIIANKILESKCNITQFENDMDMISADIIENSLSSELGAVQANIGQMLMSHLNSDNFFWTSAKSGAKGSAVNVAQVSGVLGQTNVEGTRIKKRVEGRSLVYWHKDDDTPEARGFIRNSFLTGLRGFEFIYNAMAGREGLIDTAIKSVTWETPIIIIENSLPKYVKIGEWIDLIITINSSKVQHLEDQNMELLDITDVYIPTTDYNGQVTWGQVSAVTRHDPGDKLYKIKTSGGRNVIVTGSKSLLVWNNETNQFKEMLTHDIKIGDCVPVTCELVEPPIIIEHIEISGRKTVLNFANGVLIGSYIANPSNKQIELQLGVGLVKKLQQCVDNGIINSIRYQFGKVTGQPQPLNMPDEILTSSIECVRGFLSGYINVNGRIKQSNNGSIIVLSAKSEKLINQINYLCSRIGVYGNIVNHNNNIYKFNISGVFAKKLSEEINTITHLSKIILWEKPPNLHIGNVVLDPIVSITMVDVAEHPKVYDLTIPSTFNFGLANGLQVRDTAQTGYIQRQLIKGLEDLTIRYDGTNRNARGVIIQINYGENGINQATQTELLINMLTMDNKTLNNKLGLSADLIERLSKSLKVPVKELTEFNIKHLAKLKSLRDEMRQLQSRALINYKILEEKFMLPVNLFRITQDYSNKKETLELHPQYIIDAIENFLNDYDNRLIVPLKQTDKFMKQDDRDLKFLLEVALNEYLAPVKCISEYGLNKKQFDAMMKEINLSFIKAIIEPGEMVGIVAAQSIGEPTSQMSITSQTKIKIIIKNKETIQLNTISIGKFCDEIINKNPVLTTNTGHINSVETNLSNLENEYFIVGVNCHEKTHWNKISHVSRHPVNGKLMNVTTKSGRTVTTTLSHSHLIRNNQTVEPISGFDLRVGMRIPVTKHIDNAFIVSTVKIDDIDYELDHLFGWFIGAYLARGNISEHTISISNISDHFINNTKAFEEKFNVDLTICKKTISFTNKELAQFMLSTITTNTVPNFAFTSSNEFKAGLIQAYFDGNGNFQADEICVCDKSEQLIKDISLMLNYFDIFGLIKSQNKESTQYILTINGKYGSLYQQHIGSVLHQDKLTNIVNHDMTDDIDKITGLGKIIAKCSDVLQLENCAIYEKESIDRNTLIKYISIFESNENVTKILNELLILKQAVNSDVIWDEIITIHTWTPEQTDYVYDFTVPGNQTFMIDNGIIVHNTLNTKHFAGVASKSSANMGVSRIQELVHYTKKIKTPMMMIYFKEPYSNDRTALNKTISYFKYLSIRQLINSAEVYYDAGSNDSLGNLIKNDKVSGPFFVNNQKAEISSLPFVFRIKMNIEKMMDKETTLLDIKTKFIAHWYKNYTNLKNLKKNEKDVISKISRCAILSNNITDKDQIIHIRFSMSSFNYNVITEFLRMVFDDITLKGIESINSIDVVQERVIKYDNETGEVKTDKEYMVYTAGINFEKMRMMKGIDFTRTKCNDIATILRLYGIEAVRQILLHELTATYQAGGSQINQNHLSILVDQMCHLGEISSIDRHGLSKIEMDPIARASFEKTMDHFVNAALFNEKDHIKSVSSRIAIGRVISGGTGVFDLLLDTKKLENSEYTEDETGGRVTYTPLEEEPLLQDIMKYSTGKNDFFMPV
jgi:DNA-directed RNA polymerase beta' subunit